MDDSATPAAAEHASAATSGLDDVDQALDRAVDQLVQRFPSVDPRQINDQVHQRYDELDRTASIKTHLVAITGATVAEDLRQHGDAFVVPEVADDEPEQPEPDVEREIEDERPEVD